MEAGVIANGIRRRFIRMLAIFLLVLKLPAHAQFVWEKTKLENLRLYNEANQSPVSEFTVRTNGGATVPYMMWRRTSNSGREVVYECVDCPFNYFIVTNARVFNPAVAAAFGLVFDREESTPNYYISYYRAPGGKDDLASFTYVRRQQAWIPQLTFYKRWKDEVQARLTATRFCRQNKPGILFSIDADLGFHPQSIKINGKDQTSKFSGVKGLNFWEENGTANVVFHITDERGYTLNFQFRVDETGNQAHCPSAIVQEAKLLRSLNRKGDTANRLIRIKGALKNFDPESLKVADRTGIKYWLDRRAGELRFTLYAGSDELNQGLLFSDQHNNLTLSSATLSPAQKSQLTARLSPRAIFELSSRDGKSLSKGDTLFILLDKSPFWKKEDVTFRFAPAADLPLASLRINDTPIPGSDFSLPVSENGKTLRFELEDSLGFRQEKKIILMLQDVPESPAVSNITADSIYRRYLGEGFQAGSNFRQPPSGLDKLYLENTRINLTQPFSFSYRLLPGNSSRPSLLFKKPGRIDYFSIVFRNDSALLYQQNDDGSFTNLMDGMPLDYRTGSEIVCSRVNNLLLAGETVRRDWLLINGHPFRNTNPAALWTDTFSQVGLAFPEASHNFRFGQIGLSAHTIIQPEASPESYTDIQLINRFFTGEKGEGVRTKAIFDAASRKSFAILIANSTFRPSPFGGQQPPLPAAVGIIDSLRSVLCNRFQFDSSHVKVLSDISINDLELLFRSLSDADYFQRYFGLTPEPGFNLSEIQLMIAVASHGTPDGKLVLADGWDRNLKSESYLRSLLRGSAGEPRGLFRSVLYVEDICYGTFSEGQSSPLVSGTSASKETLSELYRQGMYDPEDVSFSFHAASYNLGDMSVNLQGLRTFVNTLHKLNVLMDYYTDLDVTRLSATQAGTPALLLRPFSNDGNNARQDGRFLLLPRERYIYLPE